MTVSHLSIDNENFKEKVTSLEEELQEKESAFYYVYYCNYYSISIIIIGRIKEFQNNGDIT